MRGGHPEGYEYPSSIYNLRTTKLIPSIINFPIFKLCQVSSKLNNRNIDEIVVKLVAQI